MQRTFFAMKRVMYTLRRTFWRELSAHQLCVTPAQYEVLRILAAYDYGLPRFVLVKLLGVSGPVVSRMLGALEREGLIARGRPARDGRVVVVTLTDYGSRANLGWSGREPDFHQWIDKQMRRSFTSSEERADVEVDLLERFLWRARYNNKETSPLLDPFTRAEVRTFSGGWVPFPPPPPLEFAA